MSDRPDIVFVVTEQHRGDCLGCEGHPVLLTPTMDNLAANGVRFERFYSACPSCISARRSMLTGQSPQRHGVVGYCAGLEWDAPTLPGMLREHGYQTRLVGRNMHQFPERKRHGYEEMEITCRSGHCDYREWLADKAPPGHGGWYGGGVMHNDWTARPWHLDEHLHQTNWTVDRALRCMRRRDPSCPMFLTVSLIAAHPPLQPPAFYLERYLRTGVPDPVIGDWAAAPDDLGSDGVAPSRVALRGEALLSARAAYYGLINHVDDQLRRLINGVTGLTHRNTLIVLTSDHGEMLGDHHRWRKSLAYEPAARVPFLVAGPGALGLERGLVTGQVATHADIMPTLLELAGIPCPDTVDGVSLAPVLRGDDRPVRDEVHIEHAPEHQALTDGREKYIWSPRTGAEQLFDLETDPEELHDLSGNDAAAARLAVWRERLVDRLRDRPEEFVENDRLVPGRPYAAALPHAGKRHSVPRERWV